jgi:hypothetical protein
MLLIFIIIVVKLFLSCKKESSCEDCEENNKQLIAMAGSDQLIILPTDGILLNGSGQNIGCCFLKLGL